MNKQLPYKNNKIRINQEAVCVQIRFGNPTAGDCRNFGICKMEVYEGTVSEFQKKRGYALARFIIDNDKKQIIFEKISMTEECQDLYFGRGFFLVEAEVTLEESLSRKLEIENRSLKVGRYPFVETLMNYLIEF